MINMQPRNLKNKKNKLIYNEFGEKKNKDIFSISEKNSRMAAYSI